MDSMFTNVGKQRRNKPIYMSFLVTPKVKEGFLKNQVMCNQKNLSQQTKVTTKYKYIQQNKNITL